MSENIKVRWLTDHEQTKIAPKTLSTQIMNEDGTRFKDTVESAIASAAAGAMAEISQLETQIGELAETKVNKTDLVQADWAQNDENAIDYVKNRTHWAEQATEVVVAETTETEYVEILDGLLFNGTYIVTVDCVQYTC